MLQKQHLILLGRVRFKYSAFCCFLNNLINSIMFRVGSYKDQSGLPVCINFRSFYLVKLSVYLAPKIVPNWQPCYKDLRVASLYHF